jgi:CO dehydrogenase maturation factor
MKGRENGEKDRGGRVVMAVCGKGGVGKTTVAALLARLLVQKGEKRLLVVDADPAVGLGMALHRVPRRTLNDIRMEIVDAVREHSTDRLDLAASVDYKLMEIVEEDGMMGFLSVGRPEEEGCYCQLNSFLREAIESLSSNFEFTLIDAEAGVEQVNRRVMRSVTHLLLVSDTSMKGLQVAETLRRVAEEAVSYRKLGLVINRARDEDDYRRCASGTSLPVLGWIPEDDTVREFDVKAGNFLEIPGCPALRGTETALFKSGFIS